MSGDRKTVSLSVDAHTALGNEKRDDESFTDVVMRLCSETDSDSADAPSEPAPTLPEGVLTEAHIADISTQTAQKAADEVEHRLTRR